MAQSLARIVEAGQGESPGTLTPSAPSQSRQARATQSGAATPRPAPAARTFSQDGRFPALDDVVTHYSGMLGLQLSDAERKDLIEFLKSL